MPKLSISRDEWLQNAYDGNLEKLEGWRKSGALDIRYDPVKVGVVGIDGRAKIFDVCDQNKENALYKSLKTGQVEYAKKMLSLARFPATRNKAGQAPMHVAAENGLTEMVALLSNCGHCVDVEDNLGATPLVLSIKSNKFECVRALVEHGSCIEPSDSSNLPLMIAVGKKHVGMVEFFISRGADVNRRAASQFAETPLHRLAAMWDHEDDSEPDSAGNQIFKMLIQAGADPNATLVENGEERSVRSMFFTKKGSATFDRILVENDALILSKQTGEATFRTSSPRL